MTTIDARLDSETFRPLIFDAADSSDSAALERLVSEGHVQFVHDMILEQVAEWIASRNPSQAFPADERLVNAEKHIGAAPVREFGRWVYYPWSSRLVHVLPETEFRFLRHDRNRYKITADEQARLANCSISIAGLSVGMATATTLALEGVGRRFHLADPDTLSLSNLNRLKSGVHNLGVNKAILAARDLYEIDPYLQIHVFTTGVTDENIDEFLHVSHDQRCDLLVEECDDLYMKIRLREKARELGIPVLMETSDRGLLDIERFDRDQKQAILHGALDNVRADRLRKLSMKEKVPFILAIVEAQDAAPETLGSMIEMNRSISTWPQLASAVALGGAVATDTARRVLLGKLRESGRYRVDLEQLVRDDRGIRVVPAAELEVPVTEEARRPRGPLKMPDSSHTSFPTRDELRYIVGHAILAPSGGNIQPWKFRASRGVLDCHLDEERAASFLDFRGIASRAALGAAVENACLAAASLGFTTAVASLGSTASGFVRRLRFERASVAKDPLFDQIRRRETNRLRGDGRKLSADDAAALVGSVNAGARLQLVLDEDRRRAVGTLLGRADRLTYLSKVMHGELMREVRWTPEEVLHRRDGLDIATLGLDSTDAALFALLRSWPALEFVRSQGGGLAFTENAIRTVAACSAMGLLTVSQSADDAYFDGGRALERLWLTATERNLALRPWGLPYLFRRLELGGEGLTEEEMRDLRAIRASYREVFEISGRETEILLFSLSHSRPTQARSLRRAIDDVLVIDE